jgi:hypothetical protein
MKPAENRDRPHFLQSKLGLLTGGGLLARPSWRSLPGSPTKHGRNLPLEPRAAKHKTAIGWHRHRSDRRGWRALLPKGVAHVAP